MPNLSAGAWTIPLNHKDSSPANSVTQLTKRIVSRFRPAGAETGARHSFFCPKCTTVQVEMEEASQEMEAFTYHRPVLVRESVELLAPRAGSLVVDGTCGGGGHTIEILRTGAEVVALDKDPDAIAFAGEKLGDYGGRVTFVQANFREAGKVLD